jgi:uncharacterized membrane protein
MADFPAPQPSRELAVEPVVPTGGATLTYILFAVTAVMTVITSGFLHPPLLSWIGVIAVIVAYVKRGEARGTWLESHFRWLIRTFWWSLLWMVVGAVLFVTLIGIPIAIAMWAIASIWVLYRVIRGFLLLQDRRPAPVA